MNWTALLNQEIEATYHATLGLVDLVDDGSLDWKPATGSNWMTTGQLLEHLTMACGFCCRGFLTGNWGFPAPDAGPDAPLGAPGENDSMLVPAERMPTVKSIADARARIVADKALALAMVAEAGEAALDTRMVAAPWNPAERNLGYQFLQMVGHLACHKSQLFYYLKLQGKPVHTGSLWGM